jgi:integrase
VLTVLEGIARVHGSAPHKKTALLRDPLLELIDRIDTSTTVGLRDRALLLLGFVVGFRRSELVALSVEDLSPSSRRDPHTESRGQRPSNRAAAKSSCSSTRKRSGRAQSGRCEPGSTPRRSPPARYSAGLLALDAVSSPLTAQSVALIVKKRARNALADGLAERERELSALLAAARRREHRRGERMA